MNPYIAAGFLIAGLFIGGLVTAWFFLVKCIMSGNINNGEER